MLQVSLHGIAVLCPRYFPLLLGSSTGQNGWLYPWGGFFFLESVDTFMFMSTVASAEKGFVQVLLKNDLVNPAKTPFE